jgi:hypothetical protein
MKQRNLGKVRRKVKNTHPSQGTRVGMAHFDRECKQYRPLSY